MINFEEEIKKFEPSLEVSKLEDAIIKSEMSDFNDIIMGILKQQKKSEDKTKETARFTEDPDLDAVPIHLNQAEFSEGEYPEEEFEEKMYVPSEYDIEHE